MIPSLSVDHTVPSRRRNDALRAFLAAETEPSIEQSRDEPLEPDGHLDERAPCPRCNAVDHAAAHNGLADGRVAAPSGPVRKQYEIAADR